MNLCDSLVPFLINQVATVTQEKTGMALFIIGNK